MLRIFQWLLRDPFQTVMLGAIGDDEYNESLQMAMDDTGVRTRYLKVPHCETSKVVILTRDKFRSAIVQIGASKEFTLASLTFEDVGLIERSLILYTGGFFTCACPSFGDYLIDKRESGSIFVFNINGTYPVERNPETLLRFCKKCDVLIGNRNEFTRVAKLVGLDSTSDLTKSMKDFHNIMLQHPVVQNPRVAQMNRWKKILIVTDGADSVWCVYGDGTIAEVEPFYVPDLVDSTGAGDSFLAGFLYGLLKGYRIDTCMKIGCRTAAEIISVLGVVIPDTAPVFFLKQFERSAIRPH